MKRYHVTFQGPDYGLHGLRVTARNEKQAEVKATQQMLRITKLTPDEFIEDFALVAIEQED